VIPLQSMWRWGPCVRLSHAQSSQWSVYADNFNLVWPSLGWDPVLAFKWAKHELLLCQGVLGQRLFLDPAKESLFFDGTPSFQWISMTGDKCSKWTCLSRIRWLLRLHLIHLKSWGQFRVGWQVIIDLHASRFRARKLCGSLKGVSEQKGASASPVLKAVASEDAPTPEPASPRESSKEDNDVILLEESSPSAWKWPVRRCS